MQGQLHEKQEEGSISYRNSSFLGYRDSYVRDGNNYIGHRDSFPSYNDYTSLGKSFTSYWDSSTNCKPHPVVLCHKYSQYLRWPECVKSMVFGC